MTWRCLRLARVFTKASGQAREERRGLAITGQRTLPFWSGDERGAKFDGSDLKGLAEDLLEQFGLRGIVFGKRTESTALFLESATVTLGRKLPLGELGQLLRHWLRKYDYRGMFLAGIQLVCCWPDATPKLFKPLPQFPSGARRSHYWWPRRPRMTSVLQTVKQAVANLETVELFDVFAARACRKAEEPGLRIHLSRGGKNPD